MSKLTTVKEMVHYYLSVNKYDGLYNPFLDCGCFIDDLLPCDNYGCESCAGGYRNKDDEGNDCIGPEEKETEGK